jgi:hypothetical protein
MMRPQTEAYFHHELAEILGIPVKEMLNRMSSDEITDWMAYFKVRKYLRKQEEQRRKSQAKAKGRF